MRLLLDTHILLWRMVGSDRLSADAMRLMDEEADELLASTASVWEVSIKWSLRRGVPSDMPLSAAEFLSALKEVGIPILAIEPAHAAAVDDLPDIHRDPFDRLLIAQAQCEDLILLTADTRLNEYGDSVRLVF